MLAARKVAVQLFFWRYMSTSTDIGSSADSRPLGATSGTANYTSDRPAHVEPRRSTETKASFKTTELMVFIAAVAGVLIASDLVGGTHTHGDYFRANTAWLYIGSWPSVT